LFADTNNKKNPRVSNLYPRLKQRQRVLHTLRALIRLLKLAILGAIFYGLFLLWNMDFWLVKQVELNGLNRIGYTYVAKFSLDKKFVGQSILDINPAKVNNILQNIRLFKEIKAYRTIFPAVLTIDFVERTPYITVYEESSDHDLIIDEEGVALISGHNFKNETRSVFTLKKINNYKISSDQLNAIKVIEKLRNNKKIEDLGTFDITSPKNIVLNTSGNHILLGNLEDFVTKIKTIPVIESLSKNNKNELEYIDIRYWRNPVLKLKKGSDSYEKK
jgi:cell division septal protein FtsQ